MEDSEKETQTRTLQAVERALDIIEAVVESPEPINVTELSKRLDLPTSTVFVHLQTLQERGYILKDGTTYRPSLQLLRHGGIVRERFPVYRHSRDVIRDLADETGEFIILAVEESGRGVVILMTSGDNVVVRLPSVGKYSYLHQSAYGKAILAEHTDERIDAIIDTWGLQGLTPNTITKRDRLFSEIERTRERGYAVERGESDIGISCIGAPITNSNGNPIGAISVSVPSNKLRDEDVEEELSQNILNGVNLVELSIEDL